MALWLLSVLLLCTHLAAAAIFFSAGALWDRLVTLRWCVQRVAEAEREGLTRRR